jgi:hypothetical protein
VRRDFDPTYDRVGSFRVEWILHPGSRHVRFTPKADKETDIALSPLCARSSCKQPQQTVALFNHLVGKQLDREGHLNCRRHVCLGGTLTISIGTG